jgi:Phosphotransferase enzyme family
MTSAAALHAAATRLLGPCTVTALLGTAVARITTETGEELVVKQHATRSKHKREVHAYRHWAGALGSSAPALRAVDETAMVIITSALPGRVHCGDLPAASHHQAGALLRRFHDAGPPSGIPCFHDWLHGRASHWSSKAATLLSAADAAVIGSHLAALAGAKVPPGTPCHLDFQPRNWLISTSGDVSLIDFEHARIDLPARDFVRLRFRIWAARPDLRDAFFAGYGRPLTQAEDQLVWHLGAIDALTALVRGHETGTPQLTAAGRATLQQLRKQS